MRDRELGCVALFIVAGCRGNFDATAPDAASDAPAAAVPAVLRGCELYLRMDEAAWNGSAGEVHDSCGDDDPGRALAGAAIAVDAERGTVGTFPGTGQVLVADAPRLRGGAAVTISAWIRPEGVVGEPPSGVVAKRTTFGVKSAYTMFLWKNAHMWNDVDNEDDRVEVPSTIAANEWTQLSMVYDGGATKSERISAYVNGRLVGTFPESSARIPDAYDAPVTIGYLPDVTEPDLFFKGRIDDVVIWSRALSLPEILTWYELTER